MKDIVERMQSWRVGKLAGRDELIVDDLQSGAAEIYRLRIELQGEQVAFDLLEREVERLREQAERDCKAINGTYTVQRDLKAEIERLRDAAVIAKTTEANLHEEIERLRKERDSAFQTWKEMHVATLDGFIKQHHEPLKAEIERLRSVVKVLRRAGGNDNACCS